MNQGKGMSTAQEMDYTTLKWVKNEIDENLKQTRQALEHYVEDPQDITQLRFCTTYLHQVYGTLQMVEIYGGALLAEEMEKLAHALIEGVVRQKDDAYDVLMRAILQLPSYLEHLEQGEQDRPVILLPLLNDLRAARGDHLLSENAFFSPNLSVSTPTSGEMGDRKNIPIQTYAKKLRSVFQSSLVGLYRGEDVKSCLRKIGAVFKELLVHSDSEASKRLWWVASAVTEAMFEGGLEINNHVKQLISQIDHEIKRLINDGEKALEQSPPTELLKNLLYYVATSKSAGKRVSQIKSAFNLEHLIPNSDDISQAFESLRGSSNELMGGVTDAIKDDLLQLKDRLDVFVRNKDARSDDLLPFSQDLNRISDTLAMLGLGDLHKILSDQVKQLKQTISNGAVPNETAFMEIASALLYIESSLESIDPSDFVNRAARAARVDPMVSSDSLLPPSEQKQLSRLVISEAGDVLGKIKERFNSFANDTQQWNVIMDTPLLLNQVKGVLKVLNLNTAAQLIQASINYIAEELIKKQRSPNEAALDELADVITSIEYYLEAISEARSNPDTILGVAMSSAKKLGYDELSLATIKATDLTFISAAIERAEDSNQTLETALNLENNDGDATEIISLASDTDLTEQLHVSSLSFDKAKNKVASNSQVTEQIQTHDPDTLNIGAVAIDSHKMDDNDATAQIPAPAAATKTSAFKGQPLEDIDEEILEIFIEEADEILVSMHENLNTWRNNPADTEALPLLRRSYHTIKGSGRLAGANVVGEFAWALENMLNRVIDGKIMTSPSMFVLLEKAELALIELTKQLKGLPCDIPDVEFLSTKAMEFADGKSVSMAEEAEPLPIVESVGNKVDAEVDVDTETQTRDAKLIEIFRKEAGSHLQNVRNFISAFAHSSNDNVSEPLMRALHTLHGSARVANAAQISKVSEPLDRYFRTLYDHELPISEECFELLKQCVSYINPLIEQFDGSDQSNIAADPTSLLHALAEQHQQANDLAGEKEVAKVGSGGKQRSLGEDAELTGIFIDEAGQILDNFTNAVARWRENLQDILAIDDMQRQLQTMKSGARMASASSILEFSVELSKSIGKFADDLNRVDDSYPLFMSKAVEWFKTAVDTVAQGGNEDKSTIIRALNDLVKRFNATPSTPATDAQSSLDRIEEIELTSLPVTEEESDNEISFVDEADDASETAVFGRDQFRDDLHDTARDNIEFAVSDEEQDPELLGIFLEEAEEIIHVLEANIDEWLENPNNVAHVKELQRAMHTLKGAARMASVPSVATVSHSIESVLEKIAAGYMRVENKTTQLVQTVLEWFNVAVSQLKQGEQILLPPAKLLHEIESLMQAGDDNMLAATQSRGSIHSILGDDTEQVEMPVIDDEPISLLGEPSSQTLNAIPDRTEELHMGGIELEEIELKSVAPEEEPSVVSDRSITEQIDITPIQIGEFTDESRAPVSIDVSAEIDDNLGDADYDQDLLEIFLEEAEEIQHRSEQTLQEWSDDVQSRAHIAQLQRDLHTLKGGARMAGVSVLGDTAHAIETLLESVTEGRLQPTAQFPQCLMMCHDWIGSALAQVKKFKQIAQPAQLLARLENLKNGKDISDGIKAVAAAAAKVTKAPVTSTAELIEIPTDTRFDKDEQTATVYSASSRGNEEQIRVRADAVDSLVNYAGEANIYNARIAQQVNAWQFNLTELSQTVHRLHEQLRKFEIEAETQIMYRHTTETVSDENPDFDPLELDRFSHMQQLSRGMVESLGDLTSIKDMLGTISGEADVLLLQQSRIHSDLHESLMRTRLTPFNSVLARLRRVVRQTCQETGKEALLNVEGAEGEIDRTQLNRIVPALEHILRNAVDHGLESPERREQAKKRRDGQIDILVAREGSEIVIRIRDDGAGIDLEALRNKAIERGLISATTRLSKQELLEFILESGFSTAKNVTQISGRGVGMDVVNNEIKLLNGSLHIDSTPGSGTEFTIRLPLTVLVNQALLLSLNENRYAIPLSNIEHIVRVNNDDLNKLFSRTESHFVYAGHDYDFLDLSLILHGVPQTMAGESSRNPMLLARSGDQRVAIFVEQLLGRQEIVIKSVGPQLSGLAHISGATILPNGEVALILDISSLIRTSHTAAIDSDAILQAQRELDMQFTPTVMIVDDSITVRKVTERLLKRYNYITVTAKDGVDALTVMLETVPDIMLLDVEMPRMDGFELATAMRNDERLRSVPIIMITSRTGDKHRDRALSIGVNMYMGKPYQEHELMKNIETLLIESKVK